MSPSLPDTCPRYSPHNERVIGLQNIRIMFITYHYFFFGTTEIFMSLSPQQCPTIPSYLAIWSSRARSPASLAYFSWHYRRRRSQWPPALRRRSAVCRLLRLIVRPPTGAWLFYLLCMLYRYRCLRMNRSFIQRSRTEDVCVCVCFSVRSGASIKNQTKKEWRKKERIIAGRI